MNRKNSRNRKEVRARIIELIRSGVSIPKISHQLNLAKSTIYHHYKKIKGKQSKEAIIPLNDFILGEFLGAFAGDGSFFYDKKYGHYTLSFHFHAIDDRRYAEYLKEVISKEFKQKARFYQKPPRAMVLVFYSKKIYLLLKAYLGITGAKTERLELLKSMDELSHNFKIGFVRGVIDTDGHVNKHGFIVLSLIAKKLVLQVSEMLHEFGIQNKVALRKKQNNWKDQYELRIPKKEMKAYLSIIGFSNKRKELTATSSVSGTETH